MLSIYNIFIHHKLTCSDNLCNDRKYRKVHHMLGFKKFGILVSFFRSSNAHPASSNNFFLPVTFRLGSYEVEPEFSDTLGTISDFFKVLQIPVLVKKYLIAGTFKARFSIIGILNFSLKLFKNRRKITRSVVQHIIICHIYDANNKCLYIHVFKKQSKWPSIYLSLCSASSLQFIHLINAIFRFVIK